MSFRAPANSAKKRKRKEVDNECDDEFPAEMLSSFLQSTIGQAFAHWSVESGYDVCAVSGQPTAFRKRLRVEVKKWRAAVIRVPKDGSAEFYRMPLSVEIGVIYTLIGYCDYQTSLSLANSCEPMKSAVIFKWLQASGNALKPWLELLGLSISVRGMAVSLCLGTEVPYFRCPPPTGFCQHLYVTSQFATAIIGCGDVAFSTVFNNECHAAVIGWNWLCSQRPITNPLTTAPPLSVSMQWQTAVSGMFTLATNGEKIAIGEVAYNNPMLLLNASDGAVIAKLPSAAYVAFLNNRRLVQVDEIKGEFKLCEFTGNTLSKTVGMREIKVETMIASADGKRLYIVDVIVQQIIEYSTANWQLTARIQLSAEPLGQCDIASNGLFAQAIYNLEDDKYDICLFDTNTHSCTQFIRTKHTDIVNHVAFSPNARRIVSVSFDRSVQLFDAISGAMIGEPRLGHNDSVVSICWLTDDVFVTLAGDVISPVRIIIWHCGFQLPLATIDAHDSFDLAVNSLLRISNDSFVSANSKAVKRWKVEFK